MRRHDRRFTTHRLLLAAISFTVLAGCGDDTISPDDGATETIVDSQVIDEGGGELAGDDIVLTVPAGVLPAAAELTIIKSTASHPLAMDGIPSWRLSGLPGSLGGPVVLRIRHGAAATDSARIFFGESRQSKTAGEITSWQMAAGRDSSGWCIAELTRGPVEFEDKAATDLQLTMMDFIHSGTSAQGHFEVWYPWPTVSDEAAAWLLDAMEDGFNAAWDLGFHFGDQDTTWPRPVFCVEPGDSPMAYVSGPSAKGHFLVKPTFPYPDDSIARALAHEVMHCAQDYYDTRPPAQWVSLNRNRLWLDEATASWFELHVQPDSGRPISATRENFLAPTYGLAGTAIIDGEILMSANQYGYGMSLFFLYLVQNQGVGRVLEIYETFRDVGDATMALMQVLAPPLEDWCADFQRWYIGTDLGYFWSSEPDAVFEGKVGESWNPDISIMDFGSTGSVVEIRPSEDEPADVLKISVSDGAELAVYNLSYEFLPQLIAHAPDSLTVGLSGITTGSQEALILVTWPEGSPPGYNTVHHVELDVELAEAADLSHFDSATILLHYVAVWDDGDVPDQGMYLDVSQGTIEDFVFRSAWDDYRGDENGHFWGEFTAALDTQSLDILDWEIDYDWSYPNGSFTDMHIEGGFVPLVFADDDDLEYSVTGSAMCAEITTIEWTRRSGTSPVQTLTGWSCSPQSYLNIEFDDEVAR